MAKVAKVIVVMTSVTLVAVLKVVAVMTVMIRFNIFLFIKVIVSLPENLFHKILTNEEVLKK